MEVRAAVAWQAGKPLAVEKVQLAGPKSGEVLVEIKATGVCHTDEFTRSGADPRGFSPRSSATRAHHHPALRASFSATLLPPCSQLRMR
jgi:NADPH:quinone reductase-like Zn-dependent oxidoreductase